MSLAIVNATSPVRFLTNAINTCKTLGEGDYFLKISDIGTIRIRVTGRVSFQLDGTQITRPNLQKKLKELPSCSMEIDIHADSNIPDEGSKGKDKDKKKKKKKHSDEEGKPSKKKDKKKKMKGEVEDTEKTDFGKVTKKQLDAVYKKKQVKNALVNSAVFKKKVIKAALEAITFDGKDCKGFDILDGIDVANGKACSPEEAEAIFTNL